jgi:hypothetical protein
MNRLSKVFDKHEIAVDLVLLGDDEPCAIRRNGKGLDGRDLPLIMKRGHLAESEAGEVIKKDGEAWIRGGVQ